MGSENKRLFFLQLLLADSVRRGSVGACLVLRWWLQRQENKIVRDGPLKKGREWNSGWQFSLRGRLGQYKWTDGDENCSAVIN